MLIHSKNESVRRKYIYDMEKCVITNCCECGLPFRALGEGNYVTCPHCGAELSFICIKCVYTQKF